MVWSWGRTANVYQRFLSGVPMKTSSHDEAGEAQRDSTAGMEHRQRTVGILGGSFNPPHAGHVAIGLMSLDFGLDEVWYVVGGMASAGKDPGEFAPTSDRCAMLKLLLAGQPALKLAPRQGAYGTTVAREMRARFSDIRFLLVMGVDCLGIVPRYTPEDQELLREFPILLIRRPGMDGDLLSRAPEILRREEAADPRSLLTSGDGYVCIGSHASTPSSVLRRDLGALERNPAPATSPDKIRALLEYIRRKGLYTGAFDG